MNGYDTYPSDGFFVFTRQPNLALVPIVIVLTHLIHVHWLIHETNKITWVLVDQGQELRVGRREFLKNPLKSLGVLLHKLPVFATF